LSGRLRFDEGVPTPEVGFPRVVGWAGGRPACSPAKPSHSASQGSGQGIGFRGRRRGAQPGIAREVVWDGNLP
jgi:hypothetical protein